MRDGGMQATLVVSLLIIGLVVGILRADHYKHVETMKYIEQGYSQTTVQTGNGTRVIWTKVEPK